MKRVVRVIKKRDGGYLLTGAEKTNFFENLFGLFIIPFQLLMMLFKRRVSFRDAVIRGDVVFEGKTKEECLDFIRSLPDPPLYIEAEANL